LLFLRDVLRNPCHAVDPTRCILYGKTSIPDPAHRAIWSDHAILFVDRFASAKLLQGGTPHTLPVIGMYGVEKGFGLVVETLAGPTPDVLVGRADVEDFRDLRISQPEDLVDAFRKLPETLLRLRQHSFRVLRHNLKLLHCRLASGLALLDLFLL